MIMEGERTYDALANSLRVRLRILEVLALACTLDAGGSAIDESLALAETGIVLVTAATEVGISHTRKSATFEEIE